MIVKKKIVVLLLCFSSIAVYAMEKKNKQINKEQSDNFAKMCCVLENLNKNFEENNKLQEKIVGILENMAQSLQDHVILSQKRVDFVQELATKKANDNVSEKETEDDFFKPDDNRFKGDDDNADFLIFNGSDKNNESFSFDTSSDSGSEL